MKYREKIGKHLKENDMKKVWHGVNLMSGYKSEHSESFDNKIKIKLLLGMLMT